MQELGSVAIEKMIPEVKERTWLKVSESWRGITDGVMVAERSDGAWFFVRHIGGNWIDGEHKAFAKLLLDTYLDPKCTCSIRSDRNQCGAKESHIKADRNIKRLVSGKVGQ